MRIVFEIPTNSRKEYEYILDVARNSKEIKFSVSMNGSDLSGSDELCEQYIISKYERPEITDPAISMMEIRKNSAILADDFNPTHRVFADGDFVYKKGWEEFVKEACRDMEEFSKISGEGCYLNMAGVFGSTKNRDNTFVSGGAIMGTNCGIIYRNGFSSYPHAEILSGGYEDPYFSCIQFKLLNLIPLKKMMAKIYHPRTKMTEFRKGSIHDYEISASRNLKKVRELFGDMLWVASQSPNDKSVDSVTGIYRDSQPKSSRKEMKDARARLKQNKGLRRFFSDRDKGES